MPFVAALATLFLCQPSAPPAGAQLPQFPPVLSSAEWRSWLHELGTPVANAGGQPASADKVAASAKPSVQLPEYSVWSTGPRECWLSTGVTIHLRLVSGNLYAGVVTTDQGGKVVTVCCAATVQEDRLVFDRAVPWGPCREAKLKVLKGEGFELQPLLEGPAPANVDGVGISSRTLGTGPPRLPSSPKELTVGEWTEWTERALWSALPGVAPARQARFKDGFFVFERVGGTPWYVSDPRLSSKGSDLADVARTQEQQLRRIVKLKPETRVDLTLPSSPAAALEIDGEWVEAGRAEHRLHIKTVGKSRLAVLELLNGECVGDRAARQLSGSFGADSKSVKIKDGLMMLGATRLIVAEVDGEPVLVSDAVQTLDAWNTHPDRRLSTLGVWRKNKPAAGN